MKISLFATTLMDLEGIMLDKISQRKTNTVEFHDMQNITNKTKQKK